MSNPTGYCYAYRSAWSHPAFSNLREASIWNWLYQNAFYEDGQCNIKGHVFELKRGQIVVTISFLAKGFCMSEKGIRVVIRKLEKLGMVGVQGTSKGTILTICNYDKFQRKEKTEGKPRASRGQTEGQTEGDNNNEGNEDKRNNEGNEGALIIRKTPEELFEEFWEQYGIKEGKSDCKKKYAKLLKDGIRHEDIMLGVKNYQQECIRQNRERRHIKHPLTFLNGEHWLNDYTNQQLNGGNKNGNGFTDKLLGLEEAFAGLESFIKR